MEKKKGLGIAALVIAIFGLLGCWIPLLNIASYALFVVAIIMGIIAAVKDNGRVMAIIGIVISVLGWFVASSINSAVGEAFKSLSGDIVITQSGEIKSTNDWLGGLISESVGELNNQIQEGVNEFSDTVNDINEAISGEVHAGVETIEEGVDAVGEGVSTFGEAVGNGVDAFTDTFSETEAE